MSSVVITAWRWRLYWIDRLVDHVAGVARRIVHRGHLRAVEAGLVLEQRAIDLDRDVARQQVGEDFLLVRLIFDRGGRTGLGLRVVLRARRRPG